MHRAFLLRDLLRVALPLPVATMVATTAAPTCGRSRGQPPAARAPARARPIKPRPCIARAHRAGARGPPPRISRRDAAHPVISIAGPEHGPDPEQGLGAQVAHAPACFSGIPAHTVSAAM